MMMIYTHNAPVLGAESDDTSGRKEKSLFSYRRRRCVCIGCCYVCLRLAWRCIKMYVSSEVRTRYRKVLSGLAKYPASLRMLAWGDERQEKAKWARMLYRSQWMCRSVTINKVHSPYLERVTSVLLNDQTMDIIAKLPILSTPFGSYSLNLFQCIVIVVR